MSPTPSSLQNMKLYLRKYALQILLPESSNGTQTVITIDQTSNLRMTFDVRTVFYQSVWFAEIDLYNLDQNTTNQLIGGSGVAPTSNAGGVPVRQGMTCILSAGYLNGKYGQIFNGPVFQATFSRMNAVDFKITLHCLLWLDPLTRNFVSSTYSAFTNQTTLIQNMASKAFGGGVPVQISPNINQKPLSRGGVLFGSARQFLTQMADDNNMQWFLNSRGLNFARVDDNVSSDASSAVVFGPPPSGTGPSATQQTQSQGQPPSGIIIDTPQQTQYGVTFKALLDPTVVVKYPAMVVNINNSQIQQLKKELNQVLSILDQNGNYIVIGARYVGDTRGTPWYIEIDGYTSVNGKIAAAQYFADRASLNRQ